MRLVGLLPTYPLGQIPPSLPRTLPTLYPYNLHTVPICLPGYLVCPTNLLYYWPNKIPAKKPAPTTVHNTLFSPFVCMRIRIMQKQWNWNMSTSCLHSHSQYCLFQVSPIIREETIQQARGYWFQSSTLAAGTIICRLICSPSQNSSSIFKCNTYFTPSLHPGEPQSLVMRLQQRRNQVNPVLI